MIDYIELAGYKSISKTQRLEFQGLTILSGANSSGKSSIMQPLLLLKQTLECPYDPGPILLDGPNVRMTAGDQLISKVASDTGPNCFKVGLGMAKSGVSVKYRRSAAGAFVIDEQAISLADGTSVSLKPGVAIPHEQVVALTGGDDPVVPADLLEAFRNSSGHFILSAERERSFLNIALVRESKSGRRALSLGLGSIGATAAAIKRMFHVPGLRGNPERNYRATEVANLFPGTYETYVASIIWKWQQSNSSKLGALGDYLRLLGLTWKVEAKRIEDTRVELRVGRLPRPARGGAKDLVSLADVGLGVAQTLPVLVALLSASKGQLVYIEQPELHLHPRAQWRLSEVVRDAVNRGVKVIIETHSSVFIRGIQTQIATSRLKPNHVNLSWFSRDPADGSSIITAVTPGGDGSTGEWPGDFDDVGLEADGAYLDAVLST